METLSLISWTVFHYRVIWLKTRTFWNFHGFLRINTQIASMLTYKKSWKHVYHASVKKNVPRTSHLNSREKSVNSYKVTSWLTMEPLWQLWLESFPNHRKINFKNSCQPHEWNEITFNSKQFNSKIGFNNKLVLLLFL